MPPPLSGVELTKDTKVPYASGDPARRGWYYATASGRPSATRTGRIVIHPDCLATLSQAPPAPYALFKAGVRSCPRCGMTFSSYGGFARHLRRHDAVVEQGDEGT
jgi:hypothetical protein